MQTLDLPYSQGKRPYNGGSPNRLSMGFLGPPQLCLQIALFVKRKNARNDCGTGTFVIYVRWKTLQTSQVTRRERSELAGCEPVRDPTCGLGNRGRTPSRVS